VQKKNPVSRSKIQSLERKTITDSLISKSLPSECSKAFADKNASKKSNLVCAIIQSLLTKIPLHLSTSGSNRYFSQGRFWSDDMQTHV
jgi:hypothetical protein